MYYNKIFINFLYRIPFYSTFKVLFVMWLSAPVTRGSLVIYNYVVLPQLAHYEPVCYLISMLILCKYEFANIFSNLSNVSKEMIFLKCILLVLFFVLVQSTELTCRKSSGCSPTATRCCVDAARSRCASPRSSPSPPSSRFQFSPRAQIAHHRRL